MAISTELEVEEKAMKTWHRESRLDPNFPLPQTPTIERIKMLQAAVGHLRRWNSKLTWDCA